MVPDDVWLNFGVDPLTTILPESGADCIYIRGPTYTEYEIPLSSECGTEIETADDYILYRNMIIGIGQYNQKQT